MGDRLDITKELEYRAQHAPHSAHLPDKAPGCHVASRNFCLTTPHPLGLTSGTISGLDMAQEFMQFGAFASLAPNVAS